MTRQEVDTLIALDEKFQDRCSEICDILKEANPDMRHMDTFVIDTKHVICSGDVYWGYGGHKEFDVVSAIKIAHKGNIVSVGSGLSKEQRLRWYEHPEEIIGEIVTIQYFEETKDSKTETFSLRFPVLKHVYEGGRTV